MKALWWKGWGNELEFFRVLTPKFADGMSVIRAQEALSNGAKFPSARVFSQPVFLVKSALVHKFFEFFIGQTSDGEN